MSAAFRSVWWNLKNCGKQPPKNVHKRMINSHNSKISSQSHEAYCMELVRQKDWEGYIATLLLPKTSRRSVFAVRAFNTELSQVNNFH